MPPTRARFSGSAQQSWNGSSRISKGGGLALGCVGVAIPGASYGPGDVGLPRLLLVERKRSRLANAFVDERVSEHGAGTGEQSQGVCYRRCSRGMM